MSTQHSVWITAELPPCRAVTMAKAILFWRRELVSLETFQCAGRTGFVDHHSGLDEEALRVPSCLPAQAQRWQLNDLSSGNTTCPPGLEEREVGSLRNLIWLCSPYALARGRGAVRLEETAWGRMLPQTRAPSPLFQCGTSVAGLMHLNKPSLQQDSRSGD